MSSADPSGLEMVVERPETEDGVVLSRLDLEGIARPELLTSVPVKSGVAEELCDVLERLCVASSIKRHPDHPGFALRVFELAPAGTRAHEQPPAASEKVPLLGAPRRQEPDALPAALALLAPGPPEDVMEQTLICAGRSSVGGAAPSSRSPSASGCAGPPLCGRGKLGWATPSAAATATCRSWRAGWKEGPDSYLEVDLGADCSVTNVQRARSGAYVRSNI
ncbi:unnamed protein product [Prorocentrum cordatum]|uniref:F5/8 type C domain-containing protein n=1 Tax=Prorocentrum cordatum TaxID=2364126 RepID=A0ABN9R6T3_9DINO|nr:unnamed protein product [Polarella glacialis]